MKRLTLLLLLLLAFTAVATAATGPSILLRSRTITPPATTLAWAKLAPFNGRHVLVQFQATPNAAEREALAATGLELLVPIPEHAYLAYVQPRQWAAMKSPSPLRYVAELAPEDKIHPRLQAGKIEDYALVGDGRVDLYVRFFDDVSADDIEAAIEMADGELLQYLPEVGAAFVRANSPEDAYVLAQADAVMWVTQPSPPWGLYNNAVRPVVGAGIAHQAPYSVNGNGVKVLVYDGGIVPGTTGNAKHPDLGDRLVVGQTGVPDMIGHANHVSCTVAGDGSLSGGTYAGMAPQASIITMDFTPSGFILFYNNPGDMAASYGHAIQDLGAQTANNSIGANIGPNNYDCDWLGDYEGSAALIDEIIGGKFGREMIIVWAAGNERTSGCAGDFHLIPPPVPAKNTITVGATDVTTNEIAYFSSRGPTDDGRLKPDVAAPGHQTGGGMADTGTKSCVSNMGQPRYMNMSGTSQACPVVTGATALALEEWANVVGGDDPPPSLMKALMIHGVKDLGRPGPDYTFGYGLLQIPNSLDLILNQSYLQLTLDQGETWRQKFRRGTGAVKVTLVWTDPPGPILAQRELVNDLDLSLVGGGETFLPWVLKPNQPNVAATRGEDHVNPVEQVYIESPGEEVYEIVVQATDVPQGPQAMSLVFTGLESCDLDGDGFDDTACGGDDCRDNDDSVNPEATEICDDGIDNNCDDLLDEEDPDCAAGDDDAGDDDAGSDDDAGDVDDDDDDGGCGC